VRIDHFIDGGLVENGLGEILMLDDYEPRIAKLRVPFRPSISMTPKIICSGEFTELILMMKAET
jgi:hypothetical protein